eukprot:3149356-Rhodomonas_salina.9
MDLAGRGAVDGESRRVGGRLLGDGPAVAVLGQHADVACLSRHPDAASAPRVASCSLAHSRLHIAQARMHIAHNEARGLVSTMD